MIRLLYIARYPALAVLLLMLLAWTPVLAQNVVNEGETSTLAVIPVSGETYVWELYDDGTVNFATVPGNCPTASAEFVGANTGASVDVKWKKPGFYFFKVTAWNISGCTNNIKIGIIEVKESIPTAVLAINPDEICEGEWGNLEITFTGLAPWSIKLQIVDASGTRVEVHSGIDAANNPMNIPVGPAITTEYTVIEVSNVNGVQSDPSNTVKLTVHPLPKRTAIYLKP